MSEETLYCTECGEMLRFKKKPWKNGNLIIVCDHCGHQHCRYVSNGEVTSERWDRRSRSASKIHGVEANAN